MQDYTFDHFEAVEEMWEPIIEAERGEQGEPHSVHSVHSEHSQLIREAAESDPGEQNEPAVLDPWVDRCPACGDPIDYCQGHGEIGDPEGARILAAHDDGDHEDCHPEGCTEHEEG